MQAKVCSDCEKNGFTGCVHWEQWPDNIYKPHDFGAGRHFTQEDITCLACGFGAAIPLLLSGKLSFWDCPNYQVQCQ